MTKQEIVHRVADKAGILKKQASDAVDELFKVLIHSAVEGNDVIIPHFGTFKVKERAERKGRNPQTGEEIAIPRQRVLTFSCSRDLRDVLNARP